LSYKDGETLSFFIKGNTNVHLTGNIRVDLMYLYNDYEDEDDDDDFDLLADPYNQLPKLKSTTNYQTTLPNNVNGGTTQKAPKNAPWEVTKVKKQSTKIPAKKRTSPDQSPENIGEIVSPVNVDHYQTIDFASAVNKIKKTKKNTAATKPTNKSKVNKTNHSNEATEKTQDEISTDCVFQNTEDLSTDSNESKVKENYPVIKTATLNASTERSASKGTKDSTLSSVNSTVAKSTKDLTIPTFSKVYHSPRKMSVDLDTDAEDKEKEFVNDEDQEEDQTENDDEVVGENKETEKEEDAIELPSDEEITKSSVVDGTVEEEQSKAKEEFDFEEKAEDDEMLSDIDDEKNDGDEEGEDTVVENVEEGVEQKKDGGVGHEEDVEKDVAGEDEIETESNKVEEAELENPTDNKLEEEDHVQPTDNGSKESEDLHKTIDENANDEVSLLVETVAKEIRKSIDKLKAGYNEDEDEALEKIENHNEPKTIEKESELVTVKSSIPRDVTPINESELSATSTAKKVVKKTRSKISKGSASSISGDLTSTSKSGETSKESTDIFEPPPSTTKRSTRVTKQKAATASIDEEPGKTKKKATSKKKKPSSTDEPPIPGSMMKTTPEPPILGSSVKKTTRSVKSSTSKKSKSESTFSEKDRGNVVVKTKKRVVSPGDGEGAVVKEKKVNRKRKQKTEDVFADETLPVAGGTKSEDVKKKKKKKPKAKLPPLFDD